MSQSTRYTANSVCVLHICKLINSGAQVLHTCPTISLFPRNNVSNALFGASYEVSM